MAAPTLTLLNSTSINTAESVTNWTTFDTLDPDIVKEGSNSITGTFRADLATGHYDHGSAPVTAAGKTFRMWINTTNVAYMDTEANGGYELKINDGTTTEYKTMFSSDDYYGGWFNVVFDMDAFTTLTLANVRQWGLRVQHHTSAKNVDNVWVDALKYLDGYSMTGGTSPDPITLADIEVADRGTTTLYGYGVLTVYGGAYYATGDIQLGTGATTMYFTMDGEILIFEDKPVAAGLYSLSGVGAGSNVTIQNSYITSAGTTDATRYIFDWSDANLATFSCTGNSIVRAGAVTFKSGQTATSNIFDNCGQITHAGADMDNCTVKNYEGTANTSALIYNVNADPDGEMDGMTFEKGTAATHAIEFGTLVPATMTLRDCTFTGYNASDTQNDSTFHFKDTAGTITLNLVGCTGNFSYRSDGATIVISIDPVTQLVNIKAGGVNHQNARVFVETAATIASGEMFEASITSITQTAGTATVTTTAAHGLAVNDYVVIRGAQPDGYNKVAQALTVPTTTTFTYSVDSGLSSPATGTPVVSFVAVYGLTDASGNVSATRTWGANQQLKGWARNTVAGSPYYKQGDIAYTVDNVAGNTTNVILQPDE